jgi:hypothetical protein
VRARARTPVHHRVGVAAGGVVELKGSTQAPTPSSPAPAPSRPSAPASPSSAGATTTKAAKMPACRSRACFQ